MYKHTSAFLHRERERERDRQTDRWGFNSRFLWGIFLGSGHSKALQDTPVAALSGAWHHRVSAGTGLPSVSILRLGEIESLIHSLYLSVAAQTIVKEIRP